MTSMGRVAGVGSCFFWVALVSLAGCSGGDNASPSSEGGLVFPWLDGSALDAGNAGADGPVGPAPDATVDASTDATLRPDASQDASRDASGGADAGLCTSSATCPSGTTCCDTCVDINGSDRYNCGGCGYECDVTASCDQGTCVVATCAGGNTNDATCLVSPGKHGTCCGGTCQPIDTKTDPANCGSCGRACPLGATCGSQPPRCLSSDGGAASCQSDGSCPAGDACLFGECLPTSCAPGTDQDPCGLLGPNAKQGICCSQACTDWTRDDKNCGQCGNVCASGSFCDEGSCRANPSCSTAASGTACPVSAGVIGECCSGACVDPWTDAQNCYRCGQVCPKGETCSGGGCFLPDGGASGCGGPGDCPTGALCNGSVCLATSCAPGHDGNACAVGPPGAGEGTCCGGACVNTTEDPANCGSCGFVCASGLCESAIGIGQCLPLADAGTCPPSCPPGTVCAGGQCVASGCSGPFNLCAAQDGNVGECCYAGFSFACSDVSTDTRNCGGCGFACPSGQTCSNGVCSGVQAPCGPGKVDTYCDLDAGTSKVCCPGTGCVDLLTDPKSCGYCSNACAAGLACVSGQCVATTCAGVKDGQNCEADGGFSASSACCQGVCVDRSSSVSNCGQCGTACAGSETCSQGACGVPSCTPATTGDPCHLGAGTGQCCAAGCVDTTSDAKNCGGCGLACSQNQTCSGSACH